MSETYKIVSLEAQNIKVLKAVHITPEGNIVTLTGENGAGKSSVLDAIMYAIEGAGSICDRPVRNGTSAGKIVCNLGDLVVTRTFGATGTTIKVQNAEGVTQKSPQAILDSLVGKLAFDPMSFSRMKPDAQAALLRQLVGLDTSKLDQERAEAYNERTVANREHENAVARLALFSFDPTAPYAEVNVSHLTARLNELDEAYKVQKKSLEAELETMQSLYESDCAAVDQENEKIREHNLAIERKEVRAGELDSVISELERGLARARAERADVSDWLAKNSKKQLAVKPSAPDRSVIQKKILDAQPDTTTITNQINQASRINERVQKNRQHKEQHDLVVAKKKASDELTAKIESIDRKKSQLLEACKFPLEGLAISGDEITYKGSPLAQASDGEKLRVSVAIGMSLNSRLKVIFIRDGSLLDRKGLQLIAEMADKNGFQVWMEDARSTDPTALEIVDGQIVN